MVDNKAIDFEFGERLLSLRTMRKLSRAGAAKKMRVGLSALQQYEAGVLPGPINAEKIRFFYGCSKSWLLTGEGKPYPEEHKEACGPVDPASAARVEEFAHTYNKDAPAAPGAPGAVEVRISEAMTMTARVLESGTSYATALYLNIVHFDRAVQSETVVKRCEDDLQKMEINMRIMTEEIKKLQAQVGGLERENRRLHDQVKALSDSSGGSAPIALGMDHAAPTGTDDPAA